MERILEAWKTLLGAIEASPYLSQHFDTAAIRARIETLEQD